MFSAGIVSARPAWTERLIGRLRPGALAIVLSSSELEAVAGRRAGFELRDTILLLWPQMTSFAFLFRSPIGSGLLDQIEESGTGMLNIQMCRIGSGADKGIWPITDRSGRKSMNSAADGSLNHPVETDTTIGRWPTNVLLIHGPSCQRVGERRVEGHKGYPNGPGGSSTQFSQKGVPTTRSSSWAGHADADGKETIAVWDCQPNCPASLLDRQSGELPAGVAVRHRSGGKNFGSALDKPPMSDMGYGDKGGAARFYPQFATPWEALDWLRKLITVPGGELFEEV